MQSSSASLDVVVSGKRQPLLEYARSIIQYRDLLGLFIRRDFTTLYKQTILGPLWYLIQPVLTTLTFAVIFGGIAGIETDGVPKLLFYLLGVTLWTYFSESLLKVADTFYANQRIFTKVFFPRLILPLSLIFSNLLKLLIQFLLFLVAYVYYLSSGAQLHPSWTMLLLPLVILIEMVLALSLGMMITALTTKYRDMKFLMQFGIQLLMYASPIVYPLSAVSDKLKWVILANPMTGVIECAKFMFFGVSDFHWAYLAYSGGFAVAFLLLAYRVFSSVERNFVDTI